MIRDGEVTWQPALDINGLTVSAGVLSTRALLMLSRVLKTWAKGRRRRR